MKKLLLFFILFVTASATTYAQIQMKSSTMSINEYSEYRKEYIETEERATSNYISWKDGEIIIICTSCKTEKFMYTVLNREKKDERLKNGLTMDSYNVRKLPEGTKYTALVAYDEDKNIVSIGFAASSLGLLVIYRDLVSY